MRSLIVCLFLCQIIHGFSSAQDYDELSNENFEDRVERGTVGIEKPGRSYLEINDEWDNDEDETFKAKRSADSHDDDDDDDDDNELHSRFRRAAKYKPALPLHIANEEFRQCCIKSKFRKDCLDICTYKTSIWKLMSRMLFKKCGLMNIMPWLSCASGGENGSNNTQCCQDTKVLRGQGSVCNVLCEQYPILKPDSKFLVCGMRLKGILACHHHGLKRTPPNPDNLENSP